MNIRRFDLIIVVIAIFISTLINSEAYATTDTSKANEEKQIQTLIAETQELQHEVVELKSRVKRDEAQKVVHHPQPKHIQLALAGASSPATASDVGGGGFGISRGNLTSEAGAVASSAVNSSEPGAWVPVETSTNNVSPSLPSNSTTSNTTTTATAQTSKKSSSKSNVRKQVTVIKHLYLISDEPKYISGIPVFIAPYLGKPPEYDGSDLLTNLSVQHTDLLLLQERQSIENVFTDDDLEVPKHPFFTVSGALAAQANYIYYYDHSHQSDVDLTDAELDTMAAVTRYITGFMTIDYDNTPPNQETPPRVGPRVDNSHFFLDQGIMTIGNLNNCDWYTTLGQYYVPFGQYDGYMVSDPLTEELDQTKERAILIGYSNAGDIMEFDAQVYGYDGDASNSKNLSDGGANADVTFSESYWDADVGAGYIVDIADSLGMQLNGAKISSDIFGGFASNGENLEHKVPAYDLHGSLDLGSLGFVGEYIAPTRHFNVHNVSFNGRPARPTTYDLEAQYQFPVHGKPSAFALGVSGSQQALAFLLPKTVYSATFSTSIWFDTVESFEFTHDINYGRDDVGKGQDLPSLSEKNRKLLGRTSENFNAQIAFYF